MKVLPSLKQKKRYILFQIIAKETFINKEMKEAAFKALQQFLGDLGMAKAAPLYLKHEENTFILKVNTRYADHARAALILNKTIKNVPVITKSLHTSGTLKNIRREE